MFLLFLFFDSSGITFSKSNKLEVMWFCALGNCGCLDRCMCFSKMCISFSHFIFCNHITPSLSPTLYREVTLDHTRGICPTNPTFIWQCMLLWYPSYLPSITTCCNPSTMHFTWKRALYFRISHKYQDSFWMQNCIRCSFLLI